MVEVLVTGLLQALAKTHTHPNQKLITKAIGAGRIRGIAVEILEAMFSNPQWAGLTASKRLRAARALHSRERRLVQEGLYQIVRHHKVFEKLVPVPKEDASMMRWLAWLVTQGAPVALVNEAAASLHINADFAPISELPKSLDLSEMGMDEATALIGSVNLDLATALHNTFGEKTGDFLAASNQRADIILRTNTRHISRDALAAELSIDGLETSSTALVSTGLRCLSRANFDAIDAFHQGRFEIQDEASQLLVDLIGPINGLVVDYCAGAGGKALAIADQLGKNARILALDTRSDALDELSKRAQRSHVRSNIKMLLLSEEDPQNDVLERYREAAELVLVDAPCTGSGVLRRHPEFRWQITPEKRAALSKMQRQILNQAATLVQPNGTLIYATCSVLPAENQTIVQQFLDTHEGWRIQPLHERVGDDRAQEIGDGTFLSLTPHEHGTDGFFAAVLVR